MNTGILKDIIARAEGNQEIINWINLSLAKTNLNQSTSEHIIDWLLLCKAAPKKLKRLAVVDAARLAKAWTEKLIKKAGGIVEVDSDVKLFKDCEEHPGFRWVELINKPAFLREGNMMGHCVGSYHGKSNMKILSLRDSVNIPHCTVELGTVKGDYSDINQIKGKGNGSIHPKYIGMVISLLTELKIDVRDSELKNLGYINLQTKTWEILDAFKTKYKFLTLNNKKYYYINQ